MCLFKHRSQDREEAEHRFFQRDPCTDVSVVIFNRALGVIAAQHVDFDALTLHVVGWDPVMYIICVK